MKTIQSVRYQLTVMTVAIVLTAGALANDDISITQTDGKATVKVGGQLFTEYVFHGHSKPILYPVIGPHGIEMTRHYPIKDGVDNEALDHPHQKSLWFTHGNVNGVDFWAEYPRNNEENPFGRIVQQKFERVDNGFRTSDNWVAADGTVVCTDTRTHRFGANESGRHIDIQIALHASHGDVTFRDTKEGTMGIRTNPLLRLTSDEKRGNHTALGKSINSEGIEGSDIWGKRARWVDYWAPIDGHTVGIAIFDHPSNPRHPTWWHARTYGLVAANPFGIHDFEHKDEGTGDMLIPSEQTRTFRYRFLFHEGDAKQADVAGQFEQFAKD